MAEISEIVEIHDPVPPPRTPTPHEQMIMAMQAVDPNDRESIWDYFKGRDTPGGTEPEFRIIRHWQDNATLKNWFPNRTWNDNFCLVGTCPATDEIIRGNGGLAINLASELNYIVVGGTGNEIPEGEVAKFNPLVDDITRLIEYQVRMPMQELIEKFPGHRKEVQDTVISDLLAKSIRSEQNKIITASHIVYDDPGARSLIRMFNTIIILTDSSHKSDKKAGSDADLSSQVDWHEEFDISLDVRDSVADAVQKIKRHILK